MKEIADLIKWLQTIAKKNDDEFEYFIEIQPRRNGIQYDFTVIETADRHTFVEGAGPTIEAALANAALGISAACKEWGYKE